MKPAERGSKRRGAWLRVLRSGVAAAMADGARPHRRAGRFLAGLPLDHERRVVLIYRIGCAVVDQRPAGWRIAIRWLRSAMLRTGNDLNFASQVGPGLSLPHPLGVVIGDGVQVGRDLRVWQHVTLGSTGRAGEAAAYPVVGDGVRLFAGCVVVGSVTIGDDAIVAANAVVVRDVASGATVGGIPAKVLNDGATAGAASVAPSD